MKKLHIYLADDHAILRQGLKLLLNAQSDMEVVGEASDGKTAVQEALKLKPHIVVMDVSMPELNGQQATMAIKKVLPDCKILALSRHNDSSYLQQLLQAGVSGYVLKQSDSAELLRAIRTVIKDELYLDPAITGKVVNSLLGQAIKQTVQKSGVLTEREEDILRLIAQGYSNKDIAAHLNLSVKTVETHRTNAMIKLELKTRVDIVRYAMLCGWLINN
jgi:two-component system, NarL family, response regulator NreC